MGQVGRVLPAGLNGEGGVACIVWGGGLVCVQAPTGVG